MLNEEEIIGGTFFNQSTETTLAVQGAVDKETQRAAWTAVDDSKQYPVMETSVYNLTQDETPVLIHFGADQTQEWLLVRLEEPEEPAGE